MVTSRFFGRILSSAVKKTEGKNYQSRFMEGRVHCLSAYGNRYLMLRTSVVVSGTLRSQKGKLNMVLSQIVLREYFDTRELERDKLTNSFALDSDY
jgi:hypothetical protein